MSEFCFDIRDPNYLKMQSDPKIRPIIGEPNYRIQVLSDPKICYQDLPEYFSFFKFPNKKAHIFSLAESKQLHNFLASLKDHKEANAIFDPKKSCWVNSSNLDFFIKTYLFGFRPYDIDENNLIFGARYVSCPESASLPVLSGRELYFREIKNLPNKVQTAASVMIPIKHAVTDNIIGNGILVSNHGLIAVPTHVVYDSSGKRKPIVFGDRQQKPIFIKQSGGVVLIRLRELDGLPPIKVSKKAPPPGATSFVLGHLPRILPMNLTETYQTTLNQNLPDKLLGTVGEVSSIPNEKPESVNKHLAAQSIDLKNVIRLTNFSISANSGSVILNENGDAIGILQGAFTDDHTNDFLYSWGVKFSGEILAAIEFDNRAELPGELEVKIMQGFASSISDFLPDSFRNFIRKLGFAIDNHREDRS